MAYLNGVMVFNELGSGRFFWRQILDPGNLDALDFASAEARPDPLVGLKASHGELILFGSTSVEWWVPTGNFLSPLPAPAWRGARHWLLQRALASACSRIPWAGSPPTPRAALP